MDPVWDCEAGLESFWDDRHFAVFEQTCKSLWDLTKPRLGVYSSRRDWIQESAWECMAWAALRITVAFAIHGRPSAALRDFDSLLCPQISDGNSAVDALVREVVREALDFIARPDTTEWRGVNTFSPADIFMNAALDELWRSIDLGSARGGEIIDRRTAEGLVLLRFQRSGVASPLARLNPARQKTLLALSGLRRLSVTTCRPAL